MYKIHLKESSPYEEDLVTVRGTPSEVALYRSCQPETEGGGGRFLLHNFHYLTQQAATTPTHQLPEGKEDQMALKYMKIKIKRFFSKNVQVK